MLYNGDFELGWWKKTFTGQEYDNIFVPLGWTAWWKEGMPVPHDPENLVGYARPEMRVMLKVDPFLDPPRIYEGERAVQLFTFWKIHQAGLFQQVTVQTGHTYRFGGYAHAWSRTSLPDDPYHSDLEGDAWQNMTFSLGVDLSGGVDPFSPFVVWEAGAHIYDHYQPIFDLVFTAQEPIVTLFIRSDVLWPFKHCDAYLDAFTLEEIETPEPPDPPGVDYVVVTELLPQDATLEEKWHVLQVAHADRRTILQSADDAARLVAPGLEGSKVDVWAASRWNGDIAQYLLDRGVECVEFYEFEEEPEPPEPPDGEPQYVLRSDNCIGLHSGFTRAQSWPYIENSGTNIQKFFSAGDAYFAGLRAPGIVSIWRKYVGNDGVTDPIKTHAQWLVDQYTAEINTVAPSLGITVEQLLSKITAVESLNEQIPTFNPPIIQRAVEFDCYFAELLHARYGDLVGAVLLNVAVGNPHESEVHYLIPAAQASVTYGGYLGYHAYWARNTTQSFLVEHWPYHAGRWQEWDKVFAASGIYPRYALGEGGICYAPDGVSFNPAAGWKSCGSFELYLADLTTFNARTMAWNAEHGNRCAGLTLFCYGQWNWDDFELGDGEVILLNNWAQALK